MDICANTKQQHIIIGCQIRSEGTLCEIKFDKTKKSFLDWLTKEKVFVKIGYLACLHPQYTNKTNLKELLNIAFEGIHLDPKLVVELDPSLKSLQNAVTSNGDVFVTPPPPFELYKMKITHSRDK